MDPVRFDDLARVLSVPDSRRRVVGLLAAVPVVGGLLGFLAAEEAEGQGRRKRRKKAHKHGKGRRRKHHRKKCRAESVAQTCAGKCGSVTNNCKKAVDCGSCACTPACNACFTCRAQGANAPGTCVVDPTQQGQACGDPGQICQADGACACDASSCPGCTTCGGDGRCAACADCCDGAGVCQDGDTNAACGSSGTCDVCTGQEQCQGQSCVCIPNCTGKNCGPDGCSGSCGTCTPPQTCGGSGIANVCGACTASAFNAPCDPAHPGTCCSGICQQAGPDNHCCDPTGAVCDLGNPGTCCSLTCTNFSPPNPPVCA